MSSSLTWSSKAFCCKENISPRPGIEPGPSTWQAEILTTRLSRNRGLKTFIYIIIILGLINKQRSKASATLTEWWEMTTLHWIVMNIVRTSKSRDLNKNEFPACWSSQWARDWCQMTSLSVSGVQARHCLKHGDLKLNMWSAHVSNSVESQWSRLFW